MVKSKFYYLILFINNTFSLGVVSLLGLFYFLSALELGYFPNFENPEPLRLEYYPFFSPLINFFIGCWIYTFPLWVFAVIFYCFLNRQQLNISFLIISISLQISVIILIFSKIMGWYLD